MQYIYIGASVKNFKLKQNRVYTEKPAELIDELRGKGYSLAEKLFVPVEDFAAKEKSVSTRGTVEHLANAQLLEVR